MPGLDITLDGLRLDALATVLHRPVAVKLKGFPLLVYAPTQYGEGVRTEDNGTPVEAIVAIAAESAVADPDALAGLFGTTRAHIKQALHYAR
jgi:hypothetical protein